MKRKLFCLLTLLLAVCSGAWADAEFVIYAGGSTAPSSSKVTDATTSFAYTCANFKPTLEGISTYTNHGTYTNAIRYGGGTTDSKNHVKLEVPLGYTATIDLAYSVRTGESGSFGISTNGTKPNGSNCSIWNAAGTAGTVSTAQIADLEGNATYYIGGSGDKCLIVYLKVTLTEEKLTAPSITTQPTDGVYQKDATGKKLTVEATPSTGECAYQWYSCKNGDAEDTPESLGSENGAQTATYTIPTGAEGTFYYFCVVSDGGSNTTPSDVAKVRILDRAAKQTWDFTSVSAEDIKYNETFWTEYSANNIYTHDFVKNTDGTLEDNFGNDLADGIILRRDAGTAQTILVVGKGIAIQNNDAYYKVPVTSGNYYKVTYGSTQASKTVGFKLTGATKISGDLTHAVTTAHTETYSFIVSTTGTTLTLTNDGENQNYTMLAKIEEVTPYTIALDKNGGVTNGSAKIVEGETQLQSISAPTYDEDHSVAGYYKEAGLTTLVANAAGVLEAGVDGLTDGDGKWIATENTTLYTKWNEVVRYTVTYDLNGGLYQGSSTAPTQASVAEGTVINMPAYAPTKDDCIFTGWLCDIDDETYEVGAEYPMTANNTTFTAQFANVAGTVLIKVPVTGGTSHGTITGSIGGTATVALQSASESGGGYKFGKEGSYISLELAGGYTFQTGDVINVHTTVAANTTPGTLAIYNGDRSDVVLNTGTRGVAGENAFKLPSAVNGLTSISVYRSSTYNWNGFVDYIEVIRPNSTITLNSSGYGTYSAGTDFTYTGADAYRMVLDLGKGTLTGTMITAGTKIPAGAGILFKGRGSADVAIINTTGASSLGENDLKGTTDKDGNLVAKSGSNTFYALNGSVFKPFTGANFVANKAYFEIEAGEARSFTITFEDGETTSIAGIENKKNTEDMKFYDLSGRKVVQPTKGLYIVNGRKVVIK